MTNEFESIRVLRYKYNLEYEDFEEGTIVEIETNEGMYGTTYKGKITWIDSAYLEVDCSKECKSDIRQFKYKDIRNINRI